MRNKKDPTTRIRTRDRPMAAIYPLQSDALPTELLSETYGPSSQTLFYTFSISAHFSELLGALTRK